jgi:tetratricopeptide (TPR) repeat protein
LLPFRRSRIGCTVQRLLGAALLCLLAACAAENPQARTQLNQMNADLEQKKYNEVVTQADTFVRNSPQASGAAEALYLRGRAFEDRVNTSPTEASANLQNARISYEQALLKDPAPALEVYIRASLANVAYFQVDYATAAQQWIQAYEKLDRNDLKDWSLYRAGVAQQRLGRFIDADHTFSLVRQYFPNTLPAQRAAQRSGLRAFYVQVASFKDQRNADAFVSDLRKQGYMPQQAIDTLGRHVVRIGPVSSYPDAKRLQARIEGKYPGTLIVP